MVVVDSTLPAGVTATYDLDGTTDHRTSVTLAPGDVRLDADFGYGPAAGGGLPVTGAEFVGWMRLASMLVMAGMALVFVRRRRVLPPLS